MDWMKIFEVIVGIGAFGTVLKWLFFPRFRLKLRKINFENDRKEINEFIYFCETIKDKEYKPYPIQLQCATNILLGTSKFHYSLFVNKINYMWNLEKIRSDLFYSYFYVRQIVINNEAKLEYVIKERTLRNIEKICIWICVGAAVLYIIIIIFDLFLLRYFIENNYFNNKIYEVTKIYFLLVYVFFIFFASILGSKASAALSLKNYFDIQDKK